MLEGPDIRLRLYGSTADLFSQDFGPQIRGRELCVDFGAVK